MVGVFEPIFKNMYQELKDLSKDIGKRCDNQTLSNEPGIVFKYLDPSLVNSSLSTWSSLRNYRLIQEYMRIIIEIYMIFEYAQESYKQKPCLYECYSDLLYIYI